MRDLTLATPPSPCLECSSRSRSRRWRWSWSCRTGGRAIRATAARSLSDSRIRTCSPSGIDRRLLLVQLFDPHPCQPQWRGVKGDSLRLTGSWPLEHKLKMEKLLLDDVGDGLQQESISCLMRAALPPSSIIDTWKARKAGGWVKFALQERNSFRSWGISGERTAECEIYGNSLNVETFQAFFQRILCHICLDAHKFPASFGFLSISLRFCFLCKFLINAIHRNDPPALRALGVRRVCVNGQRAVARPALCIPDPASIDYHQFPW